MAWKLFKTDADKAEDHMIGYLEATYHIEIKRCFGAYCLVSKGRIYEFFYTLEEVRSFLEDPKSPSCEALWDLYGLKTEAEVNVTAEVKDEKVETQKDETVKEKTELKEEE